jgi:carboxypeptidase C (cathepsin A)
MISHFFPVTSKVECDMSFRTALPLSLVLPCLVYAQPAPPAQPATKPNEKQQQQQQPPGATDRLSVTEHELKTADGQALRYRATAGTMAMKDEAGKHKADLFFVAYEKFPVGEAPTARPITFVFNGGPGAAAVWLHVGTAGPKRLKLTDAGEVPPPPNVLVDNEYTWLTATDLVFIDPVNTGYSRPAPGEDPQQFFGVENDVRWVADFIRTYTTRYERWASPKFLAGESYGTTRSAMLSEHLLDRLGISLNGIILVSSVLDFSTLRPGEGNDIPYALFLPTYTATAGYHKKLPPELQKDVPAAIARAEQWALSEYVPAMAQGDALPPEKRATIARDLAAYTGLPVAVVEKSNLRIDPSLFRAALLEDAGRVVGRFDGRLSGYDPETLDRNPEFDPSLSAFLGAYSGAFNDYARRVLKFESDLNYEVLTDRVHPWNFGPAGNGHLYVADQLRGAMIKSPYLKVMIASGYHDLATPYFATRFTVNHMKLGPALRGNVSESLYEGGHMMYHRLESLRKLNGDVANFVRTTVAGPQPKVVQDGNAAPAPTTP